MQKYNFADNFKKISAPKQELNFSDLESFEELINKSKDIIYTDKDVDLRLFKLIESKRLLESSLRHQYYRKHSVLVNTPSKLKSLARKLKQVSEFAFDTETTTLRVLSKEVGKSHPLVCITISFGEHFNYYIPVSHTFTSGNISAAVVINLLQPIFNRKDLKLYMWNAKFDLHALKTFGLEVKTENIFDGMIASWLLDVSTPNGLKHNTEVLLGIPQDKIDTTMKTVTGLEKKSVGLKAANRAPFNLVRIHNGAPYALDDSYYTYVNCKILEQRLIEEDFITIYEKMYKPFIKVIFNMERAGMCVDVPKLKQMQIDMDKDLESLEFELLSLAGVQLNLGSSQQLAELLFGYSNSKNPNEAIIENSFGFPIESTTKTGAPVTDSKAIRHLAKKSYQIKRKQEGVEFCKLLLEFKKLQKLKSAFVDGLLEQLYDDGKAHPSFNIIGTTSGRISCIAKDTQITLVGEYKKIQDVKVEDKVYCYDNKGNLTISKVLNVFNNGVRPCVKITWQSTGTHKKGELICTPDHKILLAHNVWVRADELKPKDKVMHLRKSKERRPRLYGSNKQVVQEQLLIKDKVFNSTNPKECIHHLDFNPSNNKIENLKLMTLEEHASYHSKKLVSENRIKWEHLRNYEPTILAGEDNPNFILSSKEELEELIHKYKGILTSIPMDFNTFKNKCDYYGVDYVKICSQYNKRYSSKAITEEQFIETFFRCKGVKKNISKELNLGRYAVDRFIKELDLCYNHSIVNVTSTEDYEVYDLEVEHHHNFIANEVCVHNCSAPNLMQLPNAGDDDKYQIRDVFIGDLNEETNVRDHIISVDFSNLEMRVLAHFSEDPNLCETFREERDAHGDTAVKMFRLDCNSEEVKHKYKLQRNIAKTLNFLLMYGGSALTLYDSLKESGVDMDSKEVCAAEKVKNGKELAQKYYDKYFETYKGVAKYIRSQKKVARQYAYVETLVGRRRDIPEMRSSNIRDVSYGERLSVNSVIQGSGADLMINSQLRIAANDRLKELQCKMLVQIHDELLFSCPEENCEEAIDIISDIMKHPLGHDVELNIPLNVGAGYGLSYQNGH